ncbi:5-methyltetrahydropteroyltriglutamate--homocysteine methyltransferase 2 [Glycine soja]
MLTVLEKNILWVNPDCGLKTRKYTKVKPQSSQTWLPDKLIRNELANLEVIEAHYLFGVDCIWMRNHRTYKFQPLAKFANGWGIVGVEHVDSKLRVSPRSPCFKGLPLHSLFNMCFRLLIAMAMASPFILSCIFGPMLNNVNKENSSMIGLLDGS